MEIFIINNNIQESQTMNYKQIAEIIYPKESFVSVDSCVVRTSVEDVIERIVSSPDALKAIGLCKVDDLAIDPEKDPITLIQHHQTLSRCFEQKEQIESLETELDEVKQQLEDAQGCRFVATEEHCKLPDMSHYRRRSPSEKPENGHACLVKYDNNDCVLACAGEYCLKKDLVAEDIRTLYWLDGLWYDNNGSDYEMDVVIWWAYAYIPAEGEEK